METEIGLTTIGFLSGEAVIRDKHGNIKGSFKFGGPATVEEAAAVSGKSPEYIQENLGKNLKGEK